MSLVVDTISKRFDTVQALDCSADVLLYGQRPSLRSVMGAVRVDR